MRGSVITDWYEGSGYMSNHELGVLGGNDLWLCGTSATANAKLDLSKPEIAYAARQSCKNILYTYIDTNLTASSINVNAEARSALFTALWAVLDILLIGAIGALVTFAVLPYVKKGKSVKENVAAEPTAAGTGDEPSAENKE